MVLRALNREKHVSLKNLGLGKFWPGLKVSEAFVIGLKVSFCGDFVFWGLKCFEPLSKIFETRVSQSQKVSNLPFYTPTEVWRLKSGVKSSHQMLAKVIWPFYDIFSSTDLQCMCTQSRICGSSCFTECTLSNIHRAFFQYITIHGITKISLPPPLSKDLLKN